MHCKCINSMFSDEQRMLQNCRICNFTPPFCIEDFVARETGGLVASEAAAARRAQAEAARLAAALADTRRERAAFERLAGSAGDFASGSSSS